MSELNETVGRLSYLWEVNMESLKIKDHVGTNLYADLREIASADIDWTKLKNNRTFRKMQKSFKKGYIQNTDT